MKTAARFDLLVGECRRRGMAPLVVGNGLGRGLVVPELGGRLLSVEAGGRECLWYAPELAGRGEVRDWNVGGQRTWVAPELSAMGLYSKRGQWCCPEGMDPGGYRVDHADAIRVSLVNRFERSSSVGEVSIEMRRTIRVDPLPPASGQAAARVPGVSSPFLCPPRFSVSVRQSVGFAGSPPRGSAVGAWAILQVQTPGIAVVTWAPSGAHEPVYHDDFFEPVPPEWVIRGAGAVAFRLTGTRQFKLGMSAMNFARTPDVEYLRKDRPSGLWQLVRQTFLTPAGRSYVETGRGVPSPEGDLVQFYNHFTADDHTYAEIEAHGPAARAEGEESAVELRYDFSFLHREELTGSVLLPGLLAMVESA